MINNIAKALILLTFLLIISCNDNLHESHQIYCDVEVISFENNCLLLHLQGVNLENMSSVRLNVRKFWHVLDSIGSEIEEVHLIKNKNAFLGSGRLGHQFDYYTVSLSFENENIKYIRIEDKSIESLYFY